jgi:hypothetical protein
MAKFKSIETGDIVFRNGRTWIVAGVYIGALEVENQVALKALDRNPGALSESRVPLDLIDHADIYRQVDHVAAARPRLAAAG